MLLCLLSTEYEKYKARADEANARKEELFEEAKRLGTVGDRSADSKLHSLEKRLEVGGCRLAVRASHMQALRHSMHPPVGLASSSH
jgi:hypothetical protein